jgi:hypothetical protein
VRVGQRQDYDFQKLVKQIFDLPFRDDKFLKKKFDLPSRDGQEQKTATGLFFI